MAWALPALFLPLVHAATGTDGPAALALRLAREGESAAASVEFRRAALAAPLAQERAGWLWAAGWESLRGGRYESAERLFDRVEDDAPDAVDFLLSARAEIARQRGAADEARFYLHGVLETDPPGDAHAWAAARLAAGHVRDHEFREALAILDRSPRDEDDARRAIDAYRVGPRRSPRIGGWLGLVPGLGYAYSGEMANALRSLLINGLFIFALAEQAERDNWGAFTALAFFEITWYSGSIYGGVDAAHRYNQRRQTEALRVIESGREVEPDYDLLPGIRLNYRF